MAGSFIRELQRRNVVRVAVIYVIVGWILMQVADVMFPALRLPDWSATMLAAFLILGFPVALVFAWAYEITPQGLRRTGDVEPQASITRVTGRRIDFIIIGVLGIAVVLLAGRLWFDREPDRVETAVPDKSIAVLPFANRSAAEENAAFFAAGIHDDLLTLLSNLGDLKVISRTSVERLDPDLTIAEIGELLGVATVLEGQVQRAGDQLRINAQLIDAETENHLWAKTYDRELTATSVFDVQSDIARTIADALHAQLSAADETRLSRIPTTSTEALNNYLLGRQLLRRSSFEALEKAHQYFKRATESDPDYAEAWVAMAENAQHRATTGAISINEYRRIAEPAIERALAINDRLAEVHAQRAALNWRQGDAEGAEAAYERALELNPDDVPSLRAYGEYLTRNGRFVEAIPVLKRALTNDPLSVRTLFELGRANLFAGNPEVTAELNERVLEIDPASVLGYTGLIQAYWWMGRFDLMWPWWLKGMATDLNDYEFPAHAGVLFSDLGAPEWADNYLERALELGPGEPTPLKCQIQVLVPRGRHAEALAIARRALEADLDDRWGSDQVFLRVVRDEALRTGVFDRALRRYRESHPELFEDPPDFSVNNINIAADLALLMREAGEPETAEALLDAGLAWYRETQPPGVHGFWMNIVDVELLALQGDTDAALETFEQAVEGGWRTFWKWFISSPNLDALRDEPRFQALIDVIEADMAAQLEAIRRIQPQGPAFQPDQQTRRK